MFCIFVYVKVRKQRWNKLMWTLLFSSSSPQGIQTLSSLCLFVYVENIDLAFVVINLQQLSMRFLSFGALSALVLIIVLLL